MGVHNNTRLCRPGNSEGKTHIVGGKKANQFGLYDTIGNVWEWTWDWVAPNRMLIDAGGMPHGPVSRQSVIDYQQKNKKRSKKLSKTYGQRCVKGCDIFSTLLKCKDIGAGERVNVPPATRHSTLGFRVVQNKKDAK
jgi:formylglycine-generating enzyme required for sulfatase activity